MLKRWSSVKRLWGLGLLVAAVLLPGLACRSALPTRTFGEDVAFMRQHADVIVLSGRAGRSQVAVSPGLLGQIMTSTASGADGEGYGWINPKAILAGEVNAQINAYGGEDRFWLGPEGSRFSLFFDPGAPFELGNWRTPTAINEGAYVVIDQSSRHVVLHKQMQRINYAKTKLDLDVNRRINLLDRDAIQRLLGIRLADAVDFVAFESKNTITNSGKEPWTKASGLPSIWILGMLNATPDTTGAFSSSLSPPTLIVRLDCNSAAIATASPIATIQTAARVHLLATVSTILAMISAQN